MSVLLEANSVLVRAAAVQKRFPGGTEAYADRVPNRSFCSDGTLTRIGFLHPDDATEWLYKVLEPCGLGIDRVTWQSETTVIVTPENGPWVLRHRSGTSTPACPWISLAHHDDGYSYCWLAGQTPGQLAIPVGWTPAQAPIRAAEHRRRVDREWKEFAQDTATRVAHIGYQWTKEPPQVLGRFGAALVVETIFLIKSGTPWPDTVTRLVSLIQTARGRHRNDPDDAAGFSLYCATCIKDAFAAVLDIETASQAYRQLLREASQ